MNPSPEDPDFAWTLRLAAQAWAEGLEATAGFLETEAARVSALRREVRDAPPAEPRNPFLYTLR